MCMNVCHLHSFCTWRLEEGIRSPRTEVKMVVSPQVDGGAHTWVLCKNNSCSEPLIHFSSSIEIP